MTKTIQTTTLTIDLLPPERLAWELATLLNSRPDVNFPGDVGNVDRDRLESIATLLTEDPPMLAEALAEAQRGLAHAVRPDYTEDRPETYLLAAVVQALSRVGVSQAAPIDAPPVWALDRVADDAVTTFANDLFDTEAMLRATESHLSDIELRADMNDGDATNLRRLLQLSADRVARVAKELGGAGWLTRVQPSAAKPSGPVWQSVATPLAPAPEGAPAV